MTLELRGHARNKVMVAVSSKEVSILLGTQRSGAYIRYHWNVGRTEGVVATTKPVKPWQLSWCQPLTETGNC
jgi:hypothetical protein